MEESGADLRKRRILTGVRKKPARTTPSIRPAHSRHALSASAAEAAWPGLAYGKRGTRSSPGVGGGGNAELLLYFNIPALGTMRYVARRPDQGFKGLIAGFAMVFVKRHLGKSRKETAWSRR